MEHPPRQQTHSGILILFAAYFGLTWGVFLYAVFHNPFGLEVHQLVLPSYVLPDPQPWTDLLFNWGGLKLPLAFVTVLWQLCVATLLGFYLFRRYRKGKRLLLFFLFAVFCLNAMPLIATSGQNLPWLNRYAFFAVKGMVWATVAFAIWLESIPRAVFDLAETDGAGFHQQLRWIVWPQVRYFLVVLAICLLAEHGFALNGNPILCAVLNGLMLAWPTYLLVKAWGGRSQSGEREVPRQERRT